MASLPIFLGFREGAGSIHTSRTMMWSELSLILGAVPAAATPDAYATAVVEANVLGKLTRTTRTRTLQRLVELYALDSKCPLFRLLRHFWTTDTRARPVIAYLVAAARDPVLRDMTPFVVAVPDGNPVTPDQIAKSLGEKFPKRFGPSTALATAQRLASSWGQAGFLAGKVKKKRVRLVVTPVAVTFALLLGYLAGLRGKMLLDSIWTRMLGRTPAEIADLAAEASGQGWVTYKAAGAVIEITFPGLLTPQEEKAAHDAT